MCPAPIRDGAQLIANRLSPQGRTDVRPCQPPGRVEGADPVADQTDQDSLPPYEVLDAILYGLIERDQSVADLVAQGFDRDTVKKVEHLVYVSEWKRYQAAPGPRISTKAFWLDRRYPLVNRWRDPAGG